MADYFGLEAIGKRMGVNPSTIRTWWQQSRFLMYRRGRGPRMVWYTNDALIQAWEISRALKDRTAALSVRTQRQGLGSGPRVDKAGKARTQSPRADSTRTHRSGDA